jgi:hypothetical protein
MNFAVVQFGFNSLYFICLTCKGFLSWMWNPSTNFSIPFHDLKWPLSLKTGVCNGLLSCMVLGVSALINRCPMLVSRSCPVWRGWRSSVSDSEGPWSLSRDPASLTCWSRNLNLDESRCHTKCQLYTISSLGMNTRKISQPCVTSWGKEGGPSGQWVTASAVRPFAVSPVEGLVDRAREMVGLGCPTHHRSGDLKILFTNNHCFV